MCMFSVLVCSSFRCYILFFFFKQKTAYEMRISDWSSDVCSSDLAFRASPQADGAVLAAAAALRQTRRMGEGDGTDLLIVGLSATDYVGHGTGTEGSEMCLQMLALDRELGDFFARLDATGIDYLVTLTADHGGHDLPERNRQNAWPADPRVARAPAPDQIGQAVD